MPLPETTKPETRIIYMGTPDFAVPGLRTLIEQSAAQNWRVVAVVTQPDRRAGRGKKMAVSPIKQVALAHGIDVLQPASLRREPDVVDALKSLVPDVIVVTAYGLILPKSVLEIPNFGCLNIHASLLPAYRGASPINSTILHGLTETGVSIMLMDKGMDTGPVLAQARQPIHRDDTAVSLSERLADQGATLLSETLPAWLRGEIPPIDQDELPGEPSLCGLIKKNAGQIDWTQPAVVIERMTRAYAPWPSAFTTWRGQTFKIWQATVGEGDAEPGLVLQRGEEVAVGTGEGVLFLHQVQPAGKRVMGIHSLLNGAPDFVGSRLGE